MASYNNRELHCKSFNPNCRVCWNTDIFCNVEEDAIPACFTHTIAEAQNDVDKPSSGGVEGQLADKENSTILVTDNGIDENLNEIEFDTPQLDEASSTEPLHKFDTILNRWILLQQLNITTGSEFEKGSRILDLALPFNLFKSDKCSPNVLPFQQFVYTKLDLELHIKINSSKMQTGKIVACVLPNSNQLYGHVNYYNNCYAALQRQHVVLDFGSNNDAILHVDWMYHKSFMRAYPNSSIFTGCGTGEFCKIQFYMLTKLRASSTGSTSVGLSVFARLKKANFAGVSYTVAPQMLGIAKQGVSTFKGVLEHTEQFLDNVDRLVNMDKPTDLFSRMMVIPTPRLSLSHGRGPADCTPMRLDPSALTSYTGDHTRMLHSTSLKAIMRTWSLLDSVLWDTGMDNGDFLTSWVLNPSNLRGSKELRHYTTLEHVCNFFQFWRGTLEFRFDFVSSTFHTGSIQVAAEFGRQNNADMCSGASTYVKDFDLGDQKTFTFVVPYIYDTVWRRTGTIPFCNLGKTPRQTQKFVRGGLRQFVSSKLTLRVINALKIAQSTVPDTVEILVFVRAGASFETSGLISSNIFYDQFEARGDMDDFPKNYKRPTNNQGMVSDEAVDEETEDVENTPVINSSVSTPTATTTVTELPVKATANKERRALPTREKLVDGKDFLALQKLNQNMDYASKSRKIISSPALDTFKELTVNYNALGYPVTAYARAGDGYAWLSLVDFETLMEQYLPDAQSKTGENLDHTPNFNSGRVMSRLQTSERQMDMVDILRRPIMIIFNMEVKAFDMNIQKLGSGYFIPLMPVQFMMFGKNSTGFTSTTIRSPSVAITTMFRMWRGSMRYTFVFRGYKANETTIYINVMPHSGVRIMGNETYPFGHEEDVAAGKFHPACSGICTELVIPSINPTAHIEVPFNTELNWALLHQGNKGPNETRIGWRDKTDDNTGHIVITSTTAVTMDVFWAAGDDFRLAGFLGTTYGVNVPDAVDDDNASAQALWDRAMGYMPGFTHGVRSIARPAALAVTGAVAPNLVVPVAACLYGDMLNKADGVVTGLNAAVNKVNQEILPNVVVSSQQTVNMLDSIVEGGGDVMEMVKYLATSVLKPFSGEFYKNLYEKISGVLLEFFRAWISFSPTSVAMSIVSVLNQLGLLTIAWSSRILTALTSVVANVLFPPVEVNAGEEGEQEEELDTIHLANFCGLAVAALGAVFAVDTSFIGNPLLFCQGLFKQAFKPATWAILTHATRFFKDTIEFFKRIAYQIAGYKDVKTEALLQLTTKSTFLKKFVRDANLFLMETNTAATIRLPGQKLKFWMTLMNAHQILSKVIYNPKEKVSAILISLCKDVIKKGNELHVQMSNCPVRYEPFVLCVSGKPGIGKSFFVDEVIVRLLKVIGFKEMTSEIKFVKNPAPAFWNGLKDQPVIVFDDFLNIRTSPYGEEQITDLYNLKSSAIFNPNMARLEEKETRANPLLVILITNDPFPELNFITEKKAVLRRRDYMVDVVAKPGTSMKAVRSLATSGTPNYDHLMFNTYDDVTNKESYNKREWSMEDFMRDLETKFKTYHEQEKIFVKQRIEKIHSLLPSHAQTYASIEDPFSLFYATIASVDADETLHHSTTMMPSEMIDIATTRIAHQLEITTNLNSRAEVQAGVPIATMTHRALNKWKQQVQNTLTMCNNSIGVEGKCVVCAVEGKVRLGCPNSTESNPHTVCQSCMVNMARVSRVLSCPVCRSTTLLELGDVESIWNKVKRLMYNVPSGVIISAIEVAQIVLSSAFKLVELSTIITPFNLLLMSFTRFATGVNPLPGVLGLSLLWRFTNNTLGLISFPEEQTRATGSTLEVLAGNEGPDIEEFVDAVSHMHDIRDIPHTQALHRGRMVYVEMDDLPKETLDQTCVHEKAMYTLATYERNEAGEDMFFQLDLSNMESVEFSLKRCTHNCFWSVEDQLNWFREWVKVNIDFIHQTLLLRNGQHPGEFLPHCLIPNTHEQVVNRVLHVRNFDSELDALLSTTWWDKITGTCSKILTTIIPYVKYTVLAIGIINSIKTMYKWLVPNTTEEEQMGAGRYSAASTPVRTPTARSIRFVNRVSEQSGCSPAINAILKNLGHFTVTQDGLEEAWLSWVGICNHYILINKHSFNYLVNKSTDNPDKVIKVRLAYNPKVTYNVLPKLLKVVEIGLTDLICVELPPYVPLFKNIKKFFISQEKLYSSPLSTYGKMVEPPQYKEYEGTTIRDIDFTRYLSEKLVHGSEGNFVLQDIVEYNYSRKGACGGVVLSDLQDQPILGIHSAGIGVGSNGLGFAVIVTRENLDHLEVVEQADLPLLVEKDPELFFPEGTNLVVEGTVEDKFKSYIPNKTKTTKSLIAPFLPEAKTEPTILTNKDPRHVSHWLPPLIAGIVKQQVSVHMLSDSLLEEVKEHIVETKKQFKPTMLNIRTLTYEEAIMGFKDIDYFDTIPMDTSAGWPWVCMKRVKNKRAFIELICGKDNYPVSVRIDPTLKEVLDRNAQKRHNNILAPIVTSDMLKDERKKISSRKEGGTRLFSCYPIDGTIAMRQHFLHYASAMMANRFKTKMAVGIARDGKEWSALHSYLAQVGSNLVCLDYSNFGPSFSAQVFDKVIEVICAWHEYQGFSGEHVQQLRMILLEHQQCRHIARDAIYKTTAGSPSGSPGTAILNSEVNIFYIMMAWKQITNLPLYVFEDNVRLVTYGDDLIMSVSDKFVSIFNNISIFQYFTSVGIKVSSSSKGEIDTPYVTFDSADFLKSKFKPHPFRKYEYLAPMDWISVEECAKWIHKSDDAREATRVNAETSLRLAYAHGKEVFDSWKKELNKALITASLPPLTLTWKDCDDNFFEDTLFGWLPQHKCSGNAVYLVPHI
uniref:Genome polyprotein n=1 Tax=Maize-associated retrovirus 1 TaxID=2201469 RepID=A0A2U9IZM8_9RETR|nr:polyprotein [Maize-associated retrovirus 1]